MMETASTSETSVKFYQTTRRYNPEDSHLPFYWAQTYSFVCVKYPWQLDRTTTDGENGTELFIKVTLLNAEVRAKVADGPKEDT
jgi:hypothetical protein